MAMEQAFGELRHHLRRLQEALEALGTTVDEDRPTRDDNVVAARLSDDLLAVRGLLEEVSAAADNACQAVASPLDSGSPRRALTACQQRFQHVADAFSCDLAGWDRLDDLTSVGRERGQAWLDWVTVVRQGLAQSRTLSAEVINGLFRCWQELAERIATTSVSIRNTSIGQQVSAAEIQDHATTRERVP